MKRATLLRRVLKPLVFLLGLLPFGLLMYAAWHAELGPNPLETVMRGTGDWTLRFLLLTLLMTPLRRLLGRAWPLQLRRMLGLFAFFYACLHFLVWLVLDQELAWNNILADIAKRPFITVGFLAWLLLVPLALTSNRAAMRRLGRNWSRLHRSVYAIAVLGVLHFVWLVKADLLQPVIYALILSVLLLARLPLNRFRRSRHPAAPGSGLSGT